MNKRYLKVSALNKYIKAKIDNDIQLQSILIKGEISNLKKHSSNHIYFTLKDDSSRINAVMFASQAKKLNFDVKDGDKVLIEANVSVYLVTGTYQLYVNKMEPDGIGNLFLQFEQLKKKLANEGLFDPQYKKPIPLYPGKIAVLTAYPSAALMDIVKTVKMRFPVTRLIVFPIPVQGKDAYLKIIDTLQFVDSLHFNTIIIARGGGSLEDLWNFNEEKLARAIFQCHTPIISGVGHEVDFTICDFVSDYRGATPTAAAAKATPDMNEMIANLKLQQSHLITNMKHKLTSKQQQLNALQSFYLFKNPEKLYLDQLQRLSFLQEKLPLTFAHQLNKRKNQYHNYSYILNSQSKLFINEFKNQIENNTLLLKHHLSKQIHFQQEKLHFLISKLDALSPLKTLERGYAIVSHDDKNITSIEDVDIKDEISVRLKDGQFKAVVRSKEYGKNDI